MWAWLLATYGFVLRARHKVDVRLTAYASTILAGVQVFFLLLLNFAAPPFALVQGGTVPADGFGLNPLLQFPEMVIHPPMLYLGYVGFTVPFAFALGALMMRYPGEKWIHITRRWTMVTWLFLTCGIFLGAHWAYSVLGWGGYWGWDPVENASLMPWLTGTAFLHSVMMQEKRGMMKNWNVWLIFSTFMLSILGTLLTRSGLVSSVHAFAQSSIGSWFYAFLFIVLGVCIFTFILQRDHLKSDHKIESLVSRESSFLFNNLIFLAACFTILWGTLFPVLSEYVQGNRVTVGAPWYNRIAVPIGLGLLALMGLGPLLAWRSSSLRSIRRNFVLPCIATIATAVALLAIGERPWHEQGPLYSFIAFSAAAGVVTAIASEFLRGTHVVQVQTGKNILVAMRLLIQRNTRRYGGYIVHFGVVVIFIGLAGSAFNRSVEQEMDFRQSMQIGPYTLVCQDYHAGHQPQLRQRVRAARCLPQRQEDHPARAGEALLQRFTTGTDHGGQSLHPRLGPLRDLRRPEPGYQPPHHQGLPQSARRLDLDRGRHRHHRHAGRPGSKPHDRPLPGPRAPAGKGAVAPACDRDSNAARR